MSTARLRCVFFVLFAAASWAQTAVPAKLGGKVSADFVRAGVFYVINLKTEQAIITDTSGYFSIDAFVGDTLLFSAAQFRGVRVALTASIFENKLLLIKNGAYHE
jgi:hypothetical protein